MRVAADWAVALGPESLMRLGFGVGRRGEVNASLGSQMAYGLGVGQSVDLHHEVEDGAVGPASEAVIAAASYRRRDVEARQLLRMERTRGLELVVASWTQSDVASDHKVKAARLPDSPNVSFIERRRCHCATVGQQPKRLGKRVDPS